MKKKCRVYKVGGSTPPKNKEIDLKIPQYKKPSSYKYGFSNVGGGNFMTNAGFGNKKIGAGLFGMTPLSSEARNYYKGVLDANINYNVNPNLNLRVGINDEIGGGFKPGFNAGIKIKFEEGGGLPKAQEGTETAPELIPHKEAFLGDLFISDTDLEKLNSTPDLNINQLPEELQQKKQYVNYDGKNQYMSYAELATHFDGTVPWNMLREDEKQYANKYYCTTKDGCLASSYNAYDATVGQKYPSNEFLSEAKLKRDAKLQSLSDDYSVNYIPLDNPVDGETHRYEFLKDGEPVNAATDKWIRSNKDTFFDKGKGTWDFTNDSWDIHGKYVDAGGKNIWTVKDNELKSKRFSNLSESEKQKLYKQMTPGTIVGFTRKGHKGYNEKKGLGNSSHSAQVVGYAEDGVPIIFDYGVYRRIDDDENAPTYGDMSTLSNITIPRAHIGHNLEWAKKNNYFNKEGPGELDLDLSPLYEVKDADIDELDPFYNALKTNKRSLMDDLGIKPKDYNMIAKSLIGIAMEETEGGSGIIHNLENWDWSPNVGQDSVGLTQLQWHNIENDPKLKKVAAKYGITKKSDLRNSEKSAIASMIYGHRNLVSGRKNYKKGKDAGPSIRTYKPNDGWKSVVKQHTGAKPTYDGYTFYTEEGPEVDFFTGGNSVWNPFVGIGFDKSIEDIQAQFEKIAPGKYTVREVDGEYVVDKKTLGNGRRNPETGELEDLTDSEIFSYNWNSPYTLTSGDAQGGKKYVKNIQAVGELIEKKIGGEITPDNVKFTKDTLNSELANLDSYNLDPRKKRELSRQLYDAYNKSVPEKFNLGGPRLSKELKLYKNYVNGNVDSEKARKNYDKLNRVYYREAKIKNMKPANYIMTELIS